MPEASMAEGVASAHKAATVGGTKECKGCLPTIVPSPVSAIRFPVGVLPLLKEQQAVKPCCSYRGKG